MTKQGSHRRAILLVLDGVGVGEAPDTSLWGDSGSNTLCNTAQSMGGLKLPHLASMGLGNIAQIQGVDPCPNPISSWGCSLPASQGKDSTTGHWELAGLLLDEAFPTFPNGFPTEIIDRFTKATGRGVLANKVASGTQVLEEFAERQLETGEWIVYTSADSVFQIAANEESIGLVELYRACEIARDILSPPYGVSRVIARPFIQQDKKWVRTANRRDFSLPAPAHTLVDVLAESGIPRYGVGKVDDLFAGRNLNAVHTSGNEEGIDLILEWIRSDRGGLCFANLVDFDQLYGHRNDVRGFAGALEAFDKSLELILGSLRPNDLLIITADHGNDPTTPSTDHSREKVPLLVYSPSLEPRELGTRATMADTGATIAQWLGLSWRGAGVSFWGE